jgi:hypothetical protein
LIIVRPETVIKWHRQGFKLYWRWKSKAPVGRPKIGKEIRDFGNLIWALPSFWCKMRGGVSDFLLGAAALLITPAEPSPSSY